MPQVIHLKPRIEVGRAKSDVPCPHCGQRKTVWEWVILDDRFSVLAKGQAETKADAIADAKART